MCSYPSGIFPTRAYDYLSLGNLREREAARCLDPNRRMHLRAAARYAYKQAVAAESCSSRALPKRALRHNYCLSCATILDKDLSSQ